MQGGFFVNFGLFIKENNLARKVTIGVIKATSLKNRGLDPFTRGLKWQPTLRFVLTFLGEFARMAVLFQLYWGTIIGNYRPFYLFARVSLVEIGILSCASGDMHFEYLVKLL